MHIIRHTDSDYGDSNGKTFLLLSLEGLKSGWTTFFPRLPERKYKSYTSYRKKKKRIRVGSVELDHSLISESKSKQVKTLRSEHVYSVHLASHGFCSQTYPCYRTKIPLKKSKDKAIKIGNPNQNTVQSLYQSHLASNLMTITLGKAEFCTNELFFFFS